MNVTQRRAPDRRRKLQAIWEWVDLGPSMAGGPLSHPERPESAVVSTDRRNTIILTEEDGVLFNEKKV